MMKEGYVFIVINAIVRVRFMLIFLLAHVLFFQHKSQVDKLIYIRMQWFVKSL